MQSYHLRQDGGLWMDINTSFQQLSQLTTEFAMSLIVNNEENPLRSLSDIGASCIIIEAYASVLIIKTDDSNTTTWSTMGGQFAAYKIEI
jgi:hypothetical protein